MSTSTPTYRIIDEPLPTDMAKYACEPFWPLLALMLVGGWLAWPWFIFNSFVLRSASFKVELRLILGAILGSFLIHWGLLAANLDLGVSEQWLRYGMLAFPAIHLSVGYLVFIKQQGTWDLFQLFGGEGSPGMGILAMGFLTQGYIEPLFAETFLAAALR